MTFENLGTADQQIINADSLEYLKTLPEESVDCVVSDPPYQLCSIVKRFGKENSAPAQFGIDGSNSRLSRGFMGKEWDTLPTVELLKEILKVMKSGSFSFWLMTPRQDSHLEFLLRLRESGYVLGFSPLFWSYASGFPKSQNISNTIAKREGAKREGASRANAVCYGKFNPKFRELILTDKAKEFEGSFGGFQPKPAVEVIVVAMKPLREKTYVGQALENGKGITWLGNCRIPFEKADEPQAGERTKNFGDESDPISGGNGSGGFDSDPKGRFPANLLVSDNVLDNGNLTIAKKAFMRGGFGAGINTFGAGIIESERGYDDSGQFSRYFSLDSWWNERVKDLPKDIQKTFPFLIVPKASGTEKNYGLDFNAIDNSDKYAGKFPASKADKEVSNKHPTVKPISLMSYLITLGSRKGDVILDPFLGSGTTAIAAHILGRKSIGIERELEYAKIAKARLGGQTEKLDCFFS